jgi:hypothetical protein
MLWHPERPISPAGSRTFRKAFSLKPAAEEGSVIVDGPDGVVITLIAEVAEETGSRLQDSAAEALGQRHVEVFRNKRDHTD